MHVAALLLTCGIAVSAASIPRSIQSRQAGQNVVSALWDGECFYPTPDPAFKLDEYLGTWYQVAGTPFRETQGLRCVAGRYEANGDGTIKVINTALSGDTPVGANGTATPVSSAYGVGGTFRVAFPGAPSESGCPGPNYIVQEYGGEYAIVQTERWSTLYILSRERQPGQEAIDAWIQKAVILGSNATAISTYDQTNC